jgi:hypothetical protein
MTKMTVDDLNRTDELHDDIDDLLDEAKTSASVYTHYVQP